MTCMCLTSCRDCRKHTHSLGDTGSTVASDFNSRLIRVACFSPTACVGVSPTLSVGVSPTLNTGVSPTNVKCRR